MVVVVVLVTSVRCLVRSSYTPPGVCGGSGSSGTAF